MAIREQALESFEVNKYGIITSPGKFGAEMLYVPHFYAQGIGNVTLWGDENEPPLECHQVMQEDVAAFPELDGQAWVILLISGDGFVMEIAYDDLCDEPKAELDESYRHDLDYRKKGD